jgi:biotin synthase
MGEKSEDRDELLKSITSLNPESTPLNFYHPNPALPIKTRNIEVDEALTIIRGTHYYQQSTYSFG